MSHTQILPFRSSALVFVAAAFSALAACGGSASSTGGGAAGAGGSSGGAGGSSGGAGGSSGGAGGASECPQVASLLDVSQAPGAGAGYPAPTLSGSCTDTTFVVDSNAIPHYTFVATTPNPLTSSALHYEIPRFPEVAAQTTELPLLGTVGFAVNGMPFFGPNEGAVPPDEAYGDPIYNGLMDACQGHTAFTYHYHSMEEKCLTPSGLVAEPWMNADPNPAEPSPILGWALDGFPLYGPRACADAACSSVVEMKSGYAQIGDPHTNAWDAYEWQAHPGDPSYLDECNGTVGPDGTYRYHVTSTFPYLIGCYRGTVAGGGGGMGGGGTGGMMQMGPKSCASAADCALADCPDGSVGCTCSNSPMGMICVPTCATSADCPTGPMGMPMMCSPMGICVP
jgi:hypothetical protein